MRKKTIVKALVGIIVIGGGLSYFLYQAMQSSWSYYYSVDEFSAQSAAVKNSSLRIAGVVKSGSIVRDLQNVTLRFTLAGSKAEIPVVYRGSVPDNFAENREVVVQGYLDASGLFQADMLITRCESKYKAKVK